MKARIKLPYLLISCLLALLGVVAVRFSAHSVENSYAGEQRLAVEKMVVVEALLKDRIVSLGIEIEADDLNQTGLIGPEFTELTSTPGNPDAKRTSLHPLFAAAMVRYFHEAGVERGDAIAIGSSGSFPGFLIAVLCAADVMDLDVRLITSLGASMHGATRPEFNIFDILAVLKEAGLRFNMLAVSPGAANDNGGGTLEGILYFGTQELSRELCEATGYRVLLYDDLAENIQERLRLYGDGIKLFVNVGGAGVNSGVSSYTLNFPQGLVLDPPRIPMTPTRGLNYEFAAMGVPVLNLLNVRLLASENGIPYDSVPMTVAMEGPVYNSIEYSAWLAVLSILLSLSVLTLGWHKQKGAEGFPPGP